MAQQQVEAMAALRRLTLRGPGCFTTAQARAAGLTDRRLQNLVHRGELQRVYRGVYRFSAAPWTWDGRLAAAVVAAGPLACASRWLLGLEGLPRGRPELTVPGSRLPLLHGVHVHRTRVLDPGDVTEVGGLRCTTGSRTLVDLAARLSPSRRVELADEAICAGVTSRARLYERARALHAGRKGVVTLLKIAAPDADGTFWSALERHFGQGIRSAGLPSPQYNAPVRWRGRTFYADALWERQLVVAELHGLRFHRSPADRQHDDERFNAFTLAGLRCLVFTWRDVFEDMPRVVATLSDALSAAPVSTAAG